MSYRIETTTLSEECRTHNERFGARGAVTTRKNLWVIERLSPATKVVEAPTAPSRHPVICKQRTTCSGTTNQEN